MDGIEKRLEQVHQLIAAIKANRDEMVAIAVRDTGFTRRECNMEIDLVLTRQSACSAQMNTQSTIWIQ